jgi:hypothetical protein
MNRFFNALSFQVGWWACVAGVGLGLEVPALVLCLALTTALVYFSPKPLLEIKLASAAWLLGVVLDTGLQYFSIISFYGWSLGPLSPFWLWLLWIMFALTLNSSLSFLQQLPLSLSAGAGFLFGPLTYYAGAKLGAALFDNTLSHLAVLAMIWMVAMPGLVSFAKYLAHKPPSQSI